MRYFLKVCPPNSPARPTFFSPLNLSSRPAMAYPSRDLGRDFEQLRREMDRLFNDVLPGRSARGENEGDQAVWAPRADMAETEDAFVIALDVHGVSGDDLQLTLEEDTLKVSGERQFNRERHEGHLHRIERSYGRFFRAFRFGSPIDPEGVEAHFDDGELTIRVPKAEASRPRRIEVRRGSAARSAQEIDVNPQEGPDASASGTSGAESEGTPDYSGGSYGDEPGESPHTY